VSPERQWWLRTLAVFQSPRAVFAALRPDSDEEAAARQEPITALVWLAGIAVVLATRARGRFLDDPEIDEVLLPVLAFIAGGIYGVAAYWLGGAFLHAGLRGAGGRGSFRRARHVLAFASAPLALSLFLVWPLRLAIYGADSFRTGGNDEGAGVLAFDGLSAAFGLWSFALLVLGVSVIERWTIVRALVAVALAVLAIAAVTAFVLLPLTAA
jgi:hypothetical protein